MATLPPPPAAAKAATPAAPATPAASAPAVAGDEKAVKAAKKFGPGRGDEKIPVPSINGVDALAVFTKMNAALEGIDVPAYLEAFAATPSTNFPGNKQGRTAYKTAALIKLVHKMNGTLNRVAGERKPRVKTVDRISDMLKKLAAAGVNKDQIKAILGDDMTKLGVNLD